MEPSFILRFALCSSPHRKAPISKKLKHANQDQHHRQPFSRRPLCASKHPLHHPRPHAPALLRQRVFLIDGNSNLYRRLNPSRVLTNWSTTQRPSSKSSKRDSIWCGFFLLQSNSVLPS